MEIQTRIIYTSDFRGAKNMHGIYLQYYYTARYYNIMILYNTLPPLRSVFAEKTKSTAHAGDDNISRYYRGRARKYYNDNNS